MPTIDVKHYLPERITASTGRNNAGIIKSINDSHQKLEELIQACIDQLFIQTASGRFLVQLGEQEGFIMPANSGLDIRAYKALTPIMVAAPKQVRESIDDLIRAFYLSEKTRASAISAVSGPFVLQDGDDLIIETESGQVIISILSSQVSDLNNVSTSEIAAVINSSQTLVVADQIVDRATAAEFVRISAKSSGSVSKIRIAGGKLQNVLKFPNVLETNLQSGTNWNITKDTAYSDLVRFTWDGVGDNPKVYLVKPNDAITIRGLVDGADPWSLLNGSYVVVDSGYDYFIIRNTPYTSLISSMAQPDDNNIVFTDGNFLSLYDNSEYALSSEMDDSTISMTVPAIPPLSRRFLIGAAHLQGEFHEVLDFARASVKIQMPQAGARPVEDNWFVIYNNRNRINFKSKYFRTFAIDNDLSQPTYSLDTSDEFSLFPYVIDTPIGTDVIMAHPDSDEYQITFPFQHGFMRGWGITLNAASGAGNILTTDLNKEHGVYKKIDKSNLVIRLFNADGSAKKFSGAPFGPANIYQYASTQTHLGDFYLDFATTAEASVFWPGAIISIDPTAGTDVVPHIAALLKYKKFAVTAVSGTTVSFSSGIGAGAFGLIISSSTGKRSAVFGGAVTHRLDKTTDINIDNVMNGLTASFLGYTPPINPNYVGAYIYDPTGEKNNVTVSRYIVKLNQNILRGENLSFLRSDTSKVGDESFPQNGDLVIDYGTDSFEGPIRFYAVRDLLSGEAEILIDPAYKFKLSHKAGANVQFIHARQPFTPTLDGSAYPVYITGTVQARNTLFALAELLVAAGIFVEADVILPNLRYVDSAISPFD